MFYVYSHRLDLEGKRYTTASRRFEDLASAENEAKKRFADGCVVSVFIARPAGKAKRYGIAYLKRQDIIRFDRSKDGNVVRTPLL